MLKDIKENTPAMNERKKNLSREKQTLKKKQKEILQLKNIISEKF